MSAHTPAPPSGGAAEIGPGEHRAGAGPDSELPVPNPGLPPHRERLTDVDPAAAMRVERQVATMFGAASVLIVAFIVAYLAIPEHASVMRMSAMNVALGGTLGLALLCIGIGAIQWAKRLMSDREIVEERHVAASPDDVRRDAVEMLRQGVEESGFGRRTLIRRTLIPALALLGLPAILLLRDTGPLPGTELDHTIWRKGIRILNDITYTPVKKDDVSFGTLVNAVPANLLKVPDGAPRADALAKAAVIVVRIQPGEVNAAPGRQNWGVDGILCYSKICTHVGCPVNLYERKAHLVLCPCHQSTFDLADNGRVVFGPAARPLPQLPIMVDSEGYLVAQSDFTEPIGPSFWERG